MVMNIGTVLVVNEIVRRLEKEDRVQDCSYKSKPKFKSGEAYHSMEEQRKNMIMHQVEETKKEIRDAGFIIWVLMTIL